MPRRSNTPADDPVRVLVLCGLFAALVAVGTLISFPIAGGHGFINLGDAVIHVCASLLGGWHCAAAAAIGSALVDFLLGYTVFVPGSLIIKGAMCLLSGLLYRRFRFKPLAFALSGLIMPLGYLLYELLLSALGAWAPSVAIVDLPWNLIQYAAGVILGSAASVVVQRITTQKQ